MKRISNCLLVRKEHASEECRSNIRPMGSDIIFARNSSKFLKVEHRGSLSNPLDEALESSASFLSKKGTFMLRNSETIRELDTAELDQVGGGLSLGVNLDLSSELGAVSGVLDTVLGAVGGLVGGVTGGLTGG